MSNKPVVIEFKRDHAGYGKGERFVVASQAKAEELYPGATVLAYEDGSPIEKSKSTSNRPVKADPVKASLVTADEALAGRP